uniref:Uncharacterized protein n=2 Tax=Oryza TaxID=4527 RepID=A0A0D3G6T9_9ORYZ
MGVDSCCRESRGKVALLPTTAGAPPHPTAVPPPHHPSPNPTVVPQQRVEFGDGSLLNRRCVVVQFGG